MSINKIESYIPTEAHLYFPKGHEVKGTDNHRVIFDGNTQFDANELQSISQLKFYAKKQNYSLKEMWTDNMILRFLVANNFKMDKTLASIKEHTIWRETCLPVEVDAELLKLLNSGLLYVHGRDHKFRPIVIFNVYKLNPKTVDIDLVIRALTFWFNHIIEEWMLPGQIENWVFIVNLKGMGIANLAPPCVRKLFGYLQDNFKCRLYTLYVINTPSSIYIPWQVIKKFLDEVTIKKIQFCKTQIPTNLFTHANKEQVEVEFGGTAPNVVQYWPPLISSYKYFVLKEDEKALITKEEYRAMYKSGQLKNMHINKTLIAEDPVPHSRLLESSKKRKHPEPDHPSLHSSTHLPRNFSSHPNDHMNPAYAESPESQKSTDTIIESDSNEDDDDANYADYMDENFSAPNEDSRMIKEFRASFIEKLIVL